MKKILKFLIIFLIAFFLVIPQVSAWQWTAHTKIVDKIYDDLQAKGYHLDEHQMVLGAVEPDKSDLVNNKANHKYPDSVKKTVECLNKAKAAYHQGDIQSESFYYGMATHYITDTFAAPHSGWMNDKDRYYREANDLTLYYDKNLFFTGNIDELLKYGYLRGKGSISAYDNTRSSNTKKEIDQEDLNRAYTAADLIIKSNI
ncbi:MAG: zinc dependent phospholipase C family protein [Methanobacterium sp.]